MDKHHDYSFGLLYSVEPQDLPTLHLLDGNVNDVFNWDQEEDFSLIHKLLDYFKTNTHEIIKHH